VNAEAHGRMSYLHVAGTYANSVWPSFCVWAQHKQAHCAIEIVHIHGLTLTVWTEGHRIESILYGRGEEAEDKMYYIITIIYFAQSQQ